MAFSGGTSAEIHNGLTSFMGYFKRFVHKLSLVSLIYTYVSYYKFSHFSMERMGYFELIFEVKFEEIFELMFEFGKSCPLFKDGCHYLLNSLF
jgi:hypothetical protein